MDSDPIFIESEDEGADNATPVREEEEDEEYPPVDQIVCQMLLREPHDNDPKHLRVLRVGEYRISLSSSSNDQRRDPLDNRDGIAREADLEFVSSDRTSVSVRLPIVSVHALDVRKQGQMLVLRLHSPFNASDLLAHVRSTSKKELSEFALFFPSTMSRQAVSTLRAWLPHAAFRKQGASRALAVNGKTGLVFESIELTARDIQKLGDGGLLNDSCLDFFLRLTVDLMAPPKLRDKLYLASSFFYQKLTLNGLTSGAEGWKNVSRWTKSLDGGIVKQKYILVPINVKNVHWWLAILCNADRGLDRARGQGFATRGDMPRIVCLDSAVEPQDTNHKSICRNLQGYMRREFQHHLNESAVSGVDLAGGHSSDVFSIFTADVPKQENNHDCGIFMIEYVLHLLQSTTAFPGLGLAPHTHWFTQSQVSHRRQRLRWIAAMLQAEAKKCSCTDVRVLLENPSLKEMLIKALDERKSKKDKVKPNHVAPATSQKLNDIAPAKSMKRGLPGTESASKRLNNGMA